MSRKRRGVDDFLRDVRNAPGRSPFDSEHARSDYKAAQLEQNELHGSAAEAIAYAIELGMEASSFLSVWQDGSWKTMHLEWPDFPAKVRATVRPRASK